jgi:CRISPR type III-A-associated RAMP protein Csm4
LFAINKVLRGEGLRDEDYELDGHSGCLLPAAAHQPTGPFRLVRRASAPVDRLTGASTEAYPTACLQFAPGSGLWCVAAFANPIAYAVWEPKLRAAFRLLADSGFGGLRSIGFGRARQPEFQPGVLPDLLITPPELGAPPAGERRAWWLLSLFSPASSDQVHWAAGDYSLTARRGRLESPALAGPLKLEARLVREGSVVISEREPTGQVLNVAPPECPHAVWRAGYAVAVPIPYPVAARSAG